MWSLALAASTRNDLFQSKNQVRWNFYVYFGESAANRYMEVFGWKDEEITAVDFPYFD